MSRPTNRARWPRIQNDLNLLALAMRDMLDNDEPYPLTAWSAQFQRVRTDLDDALRREQQVAPVNRTPDQEQYLENSVAQFWDAADRTFALARDPNQAEARTQIRISKRGKLASLAITSSTSVAPSPARRRPISRVLVAGPQLRQVIRRRRTLGVCCTAPLLLD